MKQRWSQKRTGKKLKELRETEKLLPPFSQDGYIWKVGAKIDRKLANY